MFVTCFLLCWRFCFLFPPNSLSFSLVFPPLISSSRDTSVSDTSVSPGQVSLYTYHCRCYIQVSHDKYLYTSVPPSFTLVYRQTHSLEARLWESEINAISPLSKRERCCACNFLRAFLSDSTQVHMAANVGPKSTINFICFITCETPFLSPNDLS